ncbi:MAG: DUF805 domain-containing protein [Duncaniella sp.]|nr:DUF805 domain-containing protein [Duncaniella sp.]
MNITFIDAVKRFYANYTNFNGCATRAEYWYPVLYMFIVYVVCLCLGKFGGVILGLFCLANIIPGISVSIRRMHDIGKSGWWILISLIPIVGSIWYLVLCVTPTKELDNPFNGPAAI